MASSRHLTNTGILSRKGSQATLHDPSSYYLSIVGSHNIIDDFNTSLEEDYDDDFVV